MSHPLSIMSSLSGSNHKGATSPTEERVESAEEEEEDEEEDEEGEQRPLCSAVLGYPLVRDHALSSASNGPAQTGPQDQAYKGDQQGSSAQDFHLPICRCFY